MRRFHTVSTHCEAGERKEKSLFMGSFPDHLPVLSPFLGHFRTGKMGELSRFADTIKPAGTRLHHVVCLSTHLQGSLYLFLSKHNELR